MFSKAGLVNTFWPLILPSWFGGGAFNIFLLRQFFLQIPKELDEAALIEASRDSGRKLVVVYTSVGILHLAEGDRAGSKEFFHKSMQTRIYGVSTRRLAQNLLARLELDPTWPPWIPVKSPGAAVNQAEASEE